MSDRHGTIPVSPVNPGPNTAIGTGNSTDNSTGNSLRHADHPAGVAPHAGSGDDAHMLDAVNTTDDMAGTGQYGAGDRMTNDRGNSDGGAGDVPILSLRGVTKDFGALRASDNITLDVRRGEIHALIGPNGAGKSTLIKQIAGEIRPDHGEIRFDGRDISALDAAQRAGLGLARSFQVSSLMPEFSVLQNVMLACQARDGGIFRFFRPVLSDPRLIEPAMAQLERVGLAHRAQMRAADISHGERRQLEMAVALAMMPRVFLLDEPMAGMGPEGSHRLTAFLDGLRHQAPILLVEHDMDAVFALADRISVLVYGRIIATGTVDEIRANADVRRAYLGEDS